MEDKSKELDPATQLSLRLLGAVLPGEGTAAEAVTAAQPKKKRTRRAKKGE